MSVLNDRVELTIGDDACDPKQATAVANKMGSGKGGDLGGLAGADAHCQALAQAVGAGSKTWHAYLSTQARNGQPAVNARDRIGTGPWFNAAGAQIAANVVAVRPWEVRACRRHHVLRLGLELDRPLPHGRWGVNGPASDDRPGALHHLVGDAAPQHRPVLVHETGEEVMGLIIGDALAMIDTPVQCDVDGEGQKSHGEDCMVIARRTAR